MPPLSRRRVQRMRHTPCLSFVAAISLAIFGESGFATAQSHNPVAANQLQINLFSDTKKNQAYVKADDTFPSFVYSAVRNGDLITVQPSSKQLMAIWKRGAPLTPVPYAEGTYFEAQEQFSPVFLVADIRNDGMTPVNVKNAYLDVTESTTDYQPYLVISNDTCSDGSYDPEIGFDNYGWGKVLDPRITYAFSAGSSQSRSFTSAFPAFDGTSSASIEGGLREAGANIALIKRGNYKCPSVSQIPACFSRLKQNHVFGELATNISVDEGSIYSNISGTINYSWVDYRGVTNKSASPFKIEVPLGKFSVAPGPECGCAGPD